MRIKLTIFLFIAVAFVASARAQETVSTPTQAKPVLSEAQLKRMQEIRTAAAKKAAPVALMLAATVKQIYENMLADKEDDALRQKLDKQLNEIGSQILAVKGQSIRDMVGVLTPEQKQFVKTELAKPGATGDLGEMIERVFNLPKIDEKAVSGKQ